MVLFDTARAQALLLELETYQSECDEGYEMNAIQIVMEIIRDKLNAEAVMKGDVD